MERTTEYRGCRIDASVFATSARTKVSTVYQIAPLTEQAMEVFGGQWKRVTKAGTKIFRDMESSGGDPLHEAMESNLRLATQAIDAIFAAPREQAKSESLKKGREPRAGLLLSQWAAVVLSALL